MDEETLEFETSEALAIIVADKVKDDQVSSAAFKVLYERLQWLDHFYTERCKYDQ
jgi:hypothetical protein